MDGAMSLFSSMTDVHRPQFFHRKRQQRRRRLRVSLSVYQCS